MVAERFRNVSFCDLLAKVNQPKDERCLHETLLCSRLLVCVLSVQNDETKVLNHHTYNPCSGRVCSYKYPDAGMPHGFNTSVSTTPQNLHVCACCCHSHHHHHCHHRRHHHHNYHHHCQHHHQFVITTISINVLQQFVADSVTCKYVLYLFKITSHFQLRLGCRLAALYSTTSDAHYYPLHTSQALITLCLV